MPIKTYRDLVVWDKAMDLGAAVHQFSKERRAPRYFILMDQLQRAAGSVPSEPRWKDAIDGMLLMSAEVGRMLIGLHRALNRGPAKP